MPDVRDYEDSVIEKIKRIGVSRNTQTTGSADLLDHAMMDILSDVYGAYHLIPESDRNEYEAKYGKPNASGEPEKMRKQP